eukprot:scaffold532_cov275-Chaetoceros_neogracile.AAC.14
MGGLLKHTNWGSHEFLIAVRREIPAARKTLAKRAKGVGTPGAPPPLCRSLPIVPGGDAFYPVNLKRQEGEGGRWALRALPAEGSIRTAADG